MAKKIAIIGGGASGLLCAIECAKDSTCQIDVYEQNSKLGRKILVSGNGKCNITNTHVSQNDYTSQNPEFVRYALEKFSFRKFEKFTLNVGLILDVKDDGKVYPLSYEAKTVVSLLQNKAKSLGVRFYLDNKISTIKLLLEKYEAVVVACGSQAAPHLGGNSDGENFAREFSHNIIPTYPSLVGIELNSNIHVNMSGIKIESDVTIFINNVKSLTYHGDILFTPYGISGLAILDASNEISQALQEYQTVDISINMLPKFTPQKLSNKIAEISKNTTTLLDTLHALLPLKIANTILNELNMQHVKIPNTKEIKKITNKIQNFKFEVKDTHGFRHAEVSGGGVDTSEIDPKTMQSLKQNRLYFCGEVLDVVGRRGGFNLAWAWASGYLVAKSIKNI